MPVVRVAIFDADTVLHGDDERRSASLRDLLRTLPGFMGGYHLRHEDGRIMSFSVWESNDAMERGEQAVRERPTEDQRGIQPSVVERWVVDAAF